MKHQKHSVRYFAGASTGFMVASGGDLSEGYGHGGPGVCLRDGQTEAEGVPWQGERGDALLWRMSPYLTRPEFSCDSTKSAGPFEFGLRRTHSVM